MGKGLFDSSLKYHIMNAKKNGISKDEMAEIITHAVFYAGWPNAWAVFNMAKEVYIDEAVKEEHGGFFGMGEPNVNFAKYFIGNSYLKPLTNPNETKVFIANVTFEPGCRNNWHIHHSTNGGGQILMCIEGEGWYQEEGKPAQSLKPGDVITIPANVKHWHGAKAKSWFSHLAVEVDAIVEIADGEYGAIEIKLGGNKEEEAATSLKRFYELAEIKPKFMCIICGLYDAIVKRPDGIYVLPITALKP